MTTEYNGWTNYETWLANLWLDNDGGGELLRERAKEIAQDLIDDEETDDLAQEVTDRLASEIEGDYQEAIDAGAENLPGFARDMLNAALRQVDWHDIAEHYTDDLTVYTAGWNMPGYMPESEPAVFLELDDALEYIADELDSYAEDEVCASDDPGAYSAIQEVAEQVRKSTKPGEWTAGKFVFFVAAAE